MNFPARALSRGANYRRACPTVVIPVLMQHFIMLQRILLYTGVTRGKKLVVLVGQKKAVAIALKNASNRRQWSKLDEWLKRLPIERWLRLFGQLPADFKWIPAGVC